MIGGTHLELSDAMQDYIKALYRLEERGQPLTNSAVAEMLELTKASVSTMMKKLADKGCVRYTPYREIELTEKGRRVALEMIRHHRIIEAFLVKILGMSWDEVHDEAEKLEHVISEEVEARMAALLDDPAVDPHGHPIPGPLGEVPSRSDLVTLSTLPEGARAEVAQVSDRDPEALRYLESQGIRPGVELVVRRIHPFDGPYEVDVEGEGEALLSRRLTEMLGVRARSA